MESLIQRGPLDIFTPVLCSKLTRPFKRCKSSILLVVPAILFVSVAFAQTTTTFPSPSRCTSKDLELVRADLTGGDACNSCVEGDSVTRTLTLSINNTTSSTRTSFAFWGTLEITHADGSVTTKDLKGCNGPIVKNKINSLPYGEIKYVCGDALKIKNLFLAWTDAAGGSDCPSINSATINPKCGTLPEIQVNAGINGGFATTNVTCYQGTTGAINLTPFGGTPYKAGAAYRYAWTTSNGSIPAGQASQQDLTGLTAGTYSVTIRDSLNCTITKSVTLTGPATGLTLGTCSKTDISCAGGDGSVSAGTVSGNVGSVGYSWKNSANTVVGTTPSLSSQPASTYTLTVSDNCTTRTCSVTVAPPPAISTPAATVTQPTCSVTTGTVNVTSPASDITYKLSQSGVLKYTAASGVFSSVAPGTYDFTASKGVCSKSGSPVTVDPQPRTPAKPTVSISEPTLCGNGTATLTITNPEVDVTYTLTQNSGGINPAPVKYSSGTLSFSGLIPGKGYNITATLGNCSPDASSCAPVAGRGVVSESNTETIADAQLPISKVGVKAYPNPFNNKVRFVITSPESGNGVLEVYNMLGQKIKTVYNGYISSGSQTFEMNLPTKQRTSLIYRLRIADKQVTGKLLQLGD